ncbi:siderophore-interacting protein [Microbacterium betulae]|uniref:Siderophore-interacting protein n=1 Tax=Microbacterium betulae TaxID=2981139 RepID=A0AA97I5D1_9MICO|nr:siderophore-interacting protein [Microbacterium sp. AB]WOF22679.1 siderophore-interacting protein [Microbacterium sp. AB]
MAGAHRRVKSETQDLLRLTVQRTERLSPHWLRVTLGGGDVDRFRPMGFDQWFRLFLPVRGEAGLERVPPKANRMLGYLKFLRIPEGMRPAMRNYTVRAHRPADGSRGAEIDVDFVVHSAPDGTMGPAPTWALEVEAGEDVAIIDEGLFFDPGRGTRRVVLVSDETGLPAVAGICASLPSDAAGIAIVEVPSAEDALEFARPDGVEVRWVVRDDARARPGAAALAALDAAALPDGGFHAFAAGEQQLATGARRLLVNERGVAKTDVDFCGYWRLGATG